MLRDFLHLDEARLDQFIGQVEDGLRASRTRTESDSSSKGVSGGPPLLRGNIGTDSGLSASEEVVDSPHARFNRLVELVEGNEAKFQWVRALSDADFEGLARGQVLDVDAELYESDLTKAAKALAVVPKMQAFQEAMSQNATADGRLPSQNVLDAFGKITEMMPGSIVFGDAAESWKVVFTVPSSVDVDDEARVVGKVRTVVPAGKWELIPGAPLVDNLPREQRRAMVQAGPKRGQEQFWVEGPAVILDVLAVWK